MSCWSVSVRSLDEGVGEEEHQGDHQSCVNGSLISSLSRREKSNTNQMGVSVVEGALKGNPRKKTHWSMLVWGAAQKNDTRTSGKTMC